MEVSNLFSSRPPLEAFRVLISLMGSLQMSADSMLWNVGFFDCSRLRCFGTWYREVFAEVLEEFKHTHGRELWQSERRIEYELQGCKPHLPRSDSTVFKEVLRASALHCGFLVCDHGERG